MLGLLQYAVALPEDNLDPFPFTCSPHRDIAATLCFVLRKTEKKYATPKGGALSNTHKCRTGNCMKMNNCHKSMEMLHHVEQALIAASKQNFACYVN